MNNIQRLVYITLSGHTISRLSGELSVRISPEDILLALTQVTGKDLIEVANMDIDYVFIKNTFASSDVYKAKPIIVELIELDERILPEGTEQSLYEELIKHKGEQWVIHKNDIDPFPSNPHAHNYNANLKLHLGNGGLYHGTRLVNTINKKDLIKFRDKVTKTVLPKLAI